MRKTRQVEKKLFIVQTVFSNASTFTTSENYEINDVSIYDHIYREYTFITNQINTLEVTGFRPKC